MTYKPIHAHDKLREDALSDPETRAMYEAYKLQIELSLKHTASLNLKPKKRSR